MIRLLSIFLLFVLSTNAISQIALPPIISQQNQSAPTELGTIEWTYNTTDYASYITSSALWSDISGAGSLTSANVLGIWTVGADNSSGANTGLCYNYASTGVVTADEVCYKRYNSNRFTCVPKSSLTVGTTTTTIPTAGSINMIMQGSQGTDIDPLYSSGAGRIFECLENTQEVRITDMTGTQIEKFSVAADGAIALEPSTLAYNYVSDELYVTYRSRVNVWKRISGTWTKTGVLLFPSAEGNGPNYIDGTFIANRAFSNGALTKITEQDFNGWNNRVYSLPGNAMSDNEGVLFDPRNNLVWFNSDQNFHGGVTNGNRLYLLDPRRVYQKVLYFPGMVRYNKFKLAVNSVIVGSLNNQRIKGYDWSISPVFNFLSYTNQQTLSNFVSSNSAYDLEFRGSGSAPSTTPENSGHLDFYDPNGSNDGWGSTTPGSWSGTVPATQYVQFRIKTRPYVPPVVWTPANLGAKLKLLFVMNTQDGIWYDAANSNRVETAVNKYNPSTLPNSGNSLRYNISAGPTSIPTFVSASNYVTGTGTQYYTLSNPASILFDTQGEINYVMRSAGGTTTNQVISLAGTNPSSNNGLIRFGHYRSSDTFANAHHLTVIDAGGTTSRIGFVDTDHSTFKLVSFNSNGSTNAAFLNKVSQTLTNNAGTNTGKWMASATGATVVDVKVWRTLGGGTNAGLADMKFLMYTNAPLTTQERSDLYDWLVAQGIL